uniref:Poly [ADP-ribose] polymerase n=1 Tax=Oxyrrhis marina TaxID=2969 RepID=A0A6U9L5E1_OXYMA
MLPILQRLCRIHNLVHSNHFKIFGYLVGGTKPRTLRRAQPVNELCHEVLLRTFCQPLQPRTFCSGPTALVGQRNGRFFGSGIYFADEACKCDSYTQAESGQRTIVLARVCLGEAWFALSPKPDMKNPPDGFCAVVGESKDNGGVLDFREYVVYEGTQALPMYLIHYKHGIRCSCTRCKFSSPR